MLTSHDDKRRRNKGQVFKHARRLHRRNTAILTD